MTKRSSERDPLLEWSRKGAAQGKRTAVRNSTAPRELDLPDRKGTLELGDEVLSARRGGRTIRMTADDLMLDQLIARCLTGNNARDFEGLYQLLNAGDEAAMRRPREPSPYQLKKLLSAIRDHIRPYARIRKRLLEAGVAEIGLDGVMRPARPSRP